MAKKLTLASLDDDELYTVEEVAQIYRVSRPALYKWVKDGRIRHLYIGDALRFTGRDVRAFVRWGERTTEHPPPHDEGSDREDAEETTLPVVEDAHERDGQ